MSRTHAVVDSPLGPLTLVDEDGALLRLALDLPGSEDGARDDRGQPRAREQLTAYFAGELTNFDVPLVPAATPFAERCRAALRAIPYGETRTYGQVAAAVGQPSAVRAVGMANRRNPVIVVVPCHRVLAADGSLHGFAGGLARKQQLLDLERGATLW